MQRFRSHGKLLLTAEYLVLDGAKALAIPTSYGQELTVFESDIDGFKWESLDLYDTCWFHCTFDRELQIRTTNDQEIAKRLQQIFLSIKTLAYDAFKKNGLHFISKLDFKRNWGLGSSSTLLNNLAQWAKVNPYTLLNKTFTGSGYDIACAQAEGPVFYQIQNGTPTIEKAAFNPLFKDDLYFVHLNKKQDSREGIKRYRASQKTDLPLKKINAIGMQFCEANTLNSFQHLLEEHEQLISSIISLPPVKTQLFPDYKGAIKSLGAWGGDFILVAGDSDTMQYFEQKGYDTVVQYKDMILREEH
ncbi:GYDIA family GHMP kinase [Spongiivirga sp. MCCC 1A20706]|uniref:GYDIA family GHMP kinase n=1 Tax=Spongiivirga sp. MCCC 1A20706 TaxID=3160963 RepID=UPI0039772B9E